MLSRSAALLALALLLPVAIACRPSGEPATKAAPDHIVARYGGRTLRVADVHEEMQRLPGTSRTYLSDPDRKRDFLDRVITNDLLYDEGKRRGYGDDPEIERQVESLRERLVVQRVMRDYRKRPEIDDTEAKAYYDENRTLYSTTRVRASHILLEDAGTAAAVLAELREHPDRFDALAREKSTDTMSAKRGGDLGMFGAGRMVPEFERVAFGLSTGELSEPVETRYGFHLVKVTERKEGEVRPFDAVKAQIKSLLANKRLKERVDAEIERLREAAGITVDDEVLASIEPPPPTDAGPHGGMSGH